MSIRSILITIVFVETKIRWREVGQHKTSVNPSLFSAYWASWTQMARLGSILPRLTRSWVKTKANKLYFLGNVPLLRIIVLILLFCLVFHNFLCTFPMFNIFSGFYHGGFCVVWQKNRLTSQAWVRRHPWVPFVSLYLWWEQRFSGLKSTIQTMAKSWLFSVPLSSLPAIGSPEVNFARIDIIFSEIESKYTLPVISSTTSLICFHCLACFLTFSHFSLSD